MGKRKKSDEVLKTQRAEYARCLEAWGFVTALKSAEINELARARALVGKKHGTVSPMNWIKAVRSLRLTCDRCRGSGRYSWGPIINGVQTHSGECYHCQGRGTCTMDDAFRCRSYIRHAIVQACR